MQRRGSNWPKNPTQNIKNGKSGYSKWLDTFWTNLLILGNVNHQFVLIVDYMHPFFRFSVCWRTSRIWITFNEFPEYGLLSMNFQNMDYFQWISRTWITFNEFPVKVEVSITKFCLFNSFYLKDLIWYLMNHKKSPPSFSLTAS